MTSGISGNVLPGVETQWHSLKEFFMGLHKVQIPLTPFAKGGTIKHSFFTYNSMIKILTVIPAKAGIQVKPKLNQLPELFEKLPGSFTGEKNLQKEDRFV